MNDSKRADGAKNRSKKKIKKESIKHAFTYKKAIRKTARKSGQTARHLTRHAHPSRCSFRNGSRCFSVIYIGNSAENRTFAVWK